VVPTCRGNAHDIGIAPYLAADAGDDARSIIAALRRAEAAKGQEKAKHIAAAQTELRKLNPKQHGKLINALQAKVLALQGRGGDTAVAHLEPGEMVVPRAVLTPQLAQLIAAEATKRGIDPKQLIVGSRKASINPTTGAEEFGLFGDIANKVKGWFSHGDQLDVDEIPVTVTRRPESLSEDVPGYKFSRMIPTPTGAEGRIFTDDEVAKQQIDLYGPGSYTNNLAGANIKDMTDAELGQLANGLDRNSIIKGAVGSAVGFIPHKAATVASQGLGAWAAADQVRAGEVQRELDWRKYIRAHK
jgi:hypothetical protein